MLSSALAGRHNINADFHYFPGLSMLPSLKKTKEATVGKIADVNVGAFFFIFSMNWNADLVVLSTAKTSM